MNVIGLDLAARPGDNTYGKLFVGLDDNYYTPEKAIELADRIIMKAKEAQALTEQFPIGTMLRHVSGRIVVKRDNERKSWWNVDTGLAEDRQDDAQWRHDKTWEAMQR